MDMTEADQKEPVVLANRPSPESSPLFAIKERELDINAGILRAKKEAEELVAKARVKAVEIREKAERDGAAAAKKLTQQEAAKTKRQAEKIRASAETETAKVRDEGNKHMDRAAALIVDAVVGRNMRS